MSDLLIISLFVFGVWIVFQPNMIFETLGNTMGAILPEWVSMPLFDCPICMVPYYGTIYFLVTAQAFHVEQIFVVIGAMGLNAILARIVTILGILIEAEHKDEELSHGKFTMNNPDYSDHFNETPTVFRHERDGY